MSSFLHVRGHISENRGVEEQRGCTEALANHHLQEPRTSGEVDCVKEKNLQLPTLLLPLEATVLQFTVAFSVFESFESFSLVWFPCLLHCHSFAVSLSHLLTQLPTILSGETMSSQSASGGISKSYSFVWQTQLDLTQLKNRVNFGPIFLGQGKTCKFIFLIVLSVLCVCTFQISS